MTRATSREPRWASTALVIAERPADESARARRDASVRDMRPASCRRVRPAMARTGVRESCPLTLPGEEHGRARHVEPVGRTSRCRTDVPTASRVVLAPLPPAPRPVSVPACRGQARRQTLNTLVVCRFGDPVDAERVLPPLRALAQDGELVIGDAALVSWPPRARKPSTETLGSLTGPGELWGGSWGVLLGLIFLAPIAGPVFGAAAGAFAGTLADVGMGDDFVQSVREAVTPGTSALFVLSADADADRLLTAIDGPGLTVIRCIIAEQRLLAALGEESPAGERRA